MSHFESAPRQSGAILTHSSRPDRLAHAFLTFPMRYSASKTKIREEKPR